MDMENNVENCIVEDKEPKIMEKPGNSNLESSAVICEGSARIEVQNVTQVFYNPVQEFNRDLSVAAINIFAEEYINKKLPNEANVFNLVPGQKYENGIKVLEALSATGLRGIRYAKEIAGLKEIVCNDLSENAVKTIDNNIISNNVTNLVKSSHNDASLLMYQHKRKEFRFDVIDLDPYGCPSIFLDAAVQSVSDGGILLVTCTDMAVLAGNTPEACYIKYGSISIRSKACHEMALRIVLQCIQSHANRYGRYIKPLISLSADFYVRLVVQVFTSAKECKYSITKLAKVYRCVGCETTKLHPLGILKITNKGGEKFSPSNGLENSERCEFCNSRYHVGGPIWIGPLHSKEFLEKLVIWPGLNSLGTYKRLHGVLSVMLEELSDIPLYYTLDRLCSILHLETMPMLAFRSAILNEGYQVSYSHCSRLSIKTNAPMNIIWAILRQWESLHPVKREKLPSDSPAIKILSLPPIQDKIINFDSHKNANPPSRQYGLSRFPENPTAFWGPGTKAQSRVSAETDNQLKSKRNQGKNQHKRQKRSPVISEPKEKIVKT